MGRRYRRFFFRCIFFFRFGPIRWKEAYTAVDHLKLIMKIMDLGEIGRYIKITLPLKSRNFKIGRLKSRIFREKRHFTRKKA